MSHRQKKIPCALLPHGAGARDSDELSKGSQQPAADCSIEFATRGAVELRDGNARHILVIPGSRAFCAPGKRRSLDDGVRAREQREWDLDAELLCDLEVDDELEVRRRLHWQVARLFASSPPGSE